MSTSRKVPHITICGIPELGEHSAAGVTHVLSILGPNSADPPDFAAFAPHRRLILRFHDVIERNPPRGTVLPLSSSADHFSDLRRHSYERSYDGLWATG